MRWIWNIARDDDAVKAIFDNIRNLGLAAAVSGAGLYKYKNSAGGWDTVTAYILYGAGFLLFVLAFEHGIVKLREAKASRWVLGIVALLYSVVAAQVVQILVTRGAG